MNVLAICSWLAALVIYSIVRPRWRHIGPSLLDAYVIGLCLFGLGSIFVWMEGMENSEVVMRIGTVAAISGILGAALWSYVLAPRIAKLDFFTEARQLWADPIEHFMISAGLLISTLASLTFLSLLFFNPHIRLLLLDAFFHQAGSLNETRIIISSGSEGYFAPGYVKQFRDILVPLLCTAAILCGGAYRHRASVYLALVVALLATLISGQRLVIMQYILCLGAAFLIDRFSSRRRFAPALVVAALMICLIGSIGLMSKMLGRLDVPLSPPVGEVKYQLRQEFLADQQKKQREALAKLKSAEELKEPGTPQAQLQTVQEGLARLKAEAAAAEEEILRVRKGGRVPGELSGALISSGMPVWIATVVALTHRAVIAIPRENTATFPIWFRGAPTPGGGWSTDLAAIRPGSQQQLSSLLSEGHGDSPLGLAADVYYNWGWFGVVIIPAFYALGFLLLDIALTASRSPMTSAAKIFMFFSIPLMYSPFLFVLYGGLVAVGILCYARLRRRGALSFLDVLTQARP